MIFSNGVSSRMMSIRYLLVNAILAYNLLLGRPSLNRRSGLNEAHEDEVSLHRGRGDFHQV